MLGCGDPGKGEPTFEKVKVERILPVDAKATTNYHG